MKVDGGKLLDEGGLEAEDVEENDVNGRRGPRRGLRRIRGDARRGKGRPMCTALIEPFLEVVCNCRGPGVLVRFL